MAFRYFCVVYKTQHTLCHKRVTKTIQQWRQIMFISLYVHILCDPMVLGSSHARSSSHIEFHFYFRSIPLSRSNCGIGIWSDWVSVVLQRRAHLVELLREDNSSLAVLSDGCLRQESKQSRRLIKPWDNVSSCVWTVWEETNQFVCMKSGLNHL